MQDEKKNKVEPPLPCPIADSRVTSGLLSIAKLLDQSGVCGIPTDTVYSLAASCKNPEAIEKIYNIKVRPGEASSSHSLTCFMNTRLNSQCSVALWNNCYSVISGWH